MDHSLERRRACARPGGGGVQELGEAVVAVDGYFTDGEEDAAVNFVAELRDLS